MSWRARRALCANFKVQKVAEASPGKEKQARKTRQHDQRAKQRQLAVARYAITPTRIWAPSTVQDVGSHQ